jgi:Tfp pilus assembly pilus retraction ATPase PilT
MAGMFCMNDLLELSLGSGAEELRLRTGQAPAMIIQGKSITIDVPVMTNDHVTELFRSIATGEHIKELASCGDTHFIYAFQGSARFSVTAKMQRDALSVNFRNLSLGF